MLCYIHIPNSVSITPQHNEQKPLDLCTRATPLSPRQNARVRTRHLRTWWLYLFDAGRSSGSYTKGRSERGYRVQSVRREHRRSRPGRRGHRSGHNNKPAVLSMPHQVCQRYGVESTVQGDIKEGGHQGDGEGSR